MTETRAQERARVIIYRAHSRYAVARRDMYLLEGICQIVTEVGKKKECRVCKGQNKKDCRWNRASSHARGRQRRQITPRWVVVLARAPPQIVTPFPLSSTILRKRPPNSTVLQAARCADVASVVCLAIPRNPGCYPGTAQPHCRMRSVFPDGPG